MGSSNTTQVVTFKEQSISPPRRTINLDTDSDEQEKYEVKKKTKKLNDSGNFETELAGHSEKILGQLAAAEINNFSRVYEEQKLT